MAIKTGGMMDAIVVVKGDVEIRRGNGIIGHAI
jgi:hypothetical protein